MNWSDLGIAAFSIFVMTSLVSVFAIKLKRNDLADVFWGPGFFLSGLALFLFKKNFDPRVYIVLSLVGIWALRLFTHVGLRTLHNDKEDSRYKKMRDGWQSSQGLNSYFKVFILQGFILLVIDLPVYIIVSTSPVALDVPAFVGIAIWVFGFIIESLADSELKNFQKNPANKGKIIQEGLWSWSRHPNYFGEVAQWFGIFCLTIALPQWWIAIISPFMITFMIVKVSGVPLLEKQMEKRPGYEEYKRKTSMLILWPPRR